MSFDFAEFDDLVLQGMGEGLNISKSAKNPQNFENLPIFTVSDFVAVSNDIFEHTFPSVLIEGEISSFKINQKKFVFFDLKDENSTLGCFMTLWQMRFPIEDGMKIIAKVQPKLTAWGKFSLTVQQIIPRGEGSLKKSFEILKNKLSKEGLFAEERKRPIPRRPQNIAVISSTQAAGYVDFIKILNERWGGLKVRVAHTQVQGFSASEQIVRALEFFNSQEDLPEVIAIIRGGGSADDLVIFNDENLVRAIASSRVPVVTGIGHEVDESLCDLAADFAASTPSNVAQILTPEKSAEIEILHSKVLNLGEKLLSKIKRGKNESRDKLSKIEAGIFRKIEERRSEVDTKKRILENLNPEKVLKQGYAILRGEGQIGEILQIETHEKLITAEVKNVESK